MICRRALLVAFTTLLAGSVWAANLGVPTGPVLLTVNGAIQTANQGAAAVFDRAMLEGLDWQDIETFTHYTEGLQTFGGPTLASLLDQLGVRDGTLRAVALDDYAIEIPVADIADHEILLAIQHNGSAMRVRNRGPIWLIYPAASPEEIGQRHISHSIWQLTEIEVIR